MLFRSKINVNDLESRKRLIDTFVNSIYLYDDKIVFAFNYKDGTKTVSLAELEEELSSDLERATPPILLRIEYLLHSILILFQTGSRKGHARNVPENF